MSESHNESAAPKDAEIAEGSSPSPGPSDAADTTWADKYGSVLKPIALKYGEQLFNFTMSIGVANVAVMTIMRRVRGNQELTRAMMILVNILDVQAKQILALTNNTELFLACKAEIESSSPAIMVPENGGQIIVPS